jgi:hypothetical protein
MQVAIEYDLEVMMPLLLLVYKSKLKTIFNMVGIIIGLKHCQLGIENLEKLVLIMKKMILDLDKQTPNLNQLRNT